MLRRETEFAVRKAAAGVANSSSSLAAAAAAADAPAQGDGSGGERDGDGGLAEDDRAGVDVPVPALFPSAGDAPSSQGSSADWLAPLVAAAEARVAPVLAAYGNALWPGTGPPPSASASVSAAPYKATQVSPAAYGRGGGGMSATAAAADMDDNEDEDDDDSDAASDDAPGARRRREEEARFATLPEQSVALPWHAPTAILSARDHPLWEEVYALLDVGGGRVGVPCCAFLAHAETGELLRERCRQCRRLLLEAPVRHAGPRPASARGLGSNGMRFSFCFC